MTDFNFGPCYKMIQSQTFCGRTESHYEKNYKNLRICPTVLKPASIDFER